MALVKEDIQIRRRDFLRAVAAALGSTSLASLASACSLCPPALRPPRTGARVLTDLHVHPLMNEWLRRTPAGVTDPALLNVVRAEFNPTETVWKSLYEAGVDVLCAAHVNVFDEWLSMPTDPSNEAPMHTNAMLDLLEAILAGPARPYAKLTKTAEELSKVTVFRPGDSEYRVAVVHALEGGQALGGRLENIGVFAKRGVAMITVTHFFQKGISSAPNAFPFFPDAGASWAPDGLTGFGKDVIHEMEHAGIIVDVTHMTDAALDDVFKTATRPFVATHASARVLGDHPYSFPDEQIQEIANREGMIGVILYPYVLSNFADEEVVGKQGSIRDTVRTILHITKLCGTHKHIGIGSDFAGFIQGPKEFSCLGRIGLLREQLEREFGDPDIVEDIMARNALAFLSRNWGRR